MLWAYQDKWHSINPPGDEPPIIIKAGLTDLELEILEQNLLFIDQEYQIQIREWVKRSHILPYKNEKSRLV